MFEKITDPQIFEVSNNCLSATLAASSAAAAALAVLFEAFAVIALAPVVAPAAAPIINKASTAQFNNFNQIYNV